MTKSQSKYFNTACLMDEALLYLLEKKEFAFVTVKEICKKAGVNRSTFYLHYESTLDLLAETNDYLNKKFFDAYKSQGIEKPDVKSVSKEESVFITPKYLLPYLQFVKANKRFLKTVYNNPALFEAEKTFHKMYKDFFAPAMEKFNVEKEKEEYVFDFYTKGVLAIIVKWLNNDCKDDVEFVLNLIIDCVNVPKM